MYKFILSIYNLQDVKRGTYGSKYGKKNHAQRRKADRCTAPGELFRSAQNWVKLQDEYECYYFIADWHALTTGYEDTSELKSCITNIVIDWLSVGLDPEKSTLFLQSAVKEHAELHLLFSMITPLSWLYRCPTYKDQIQQLKDKNILTYGFLGYPCLRLPTSSCTRPPPCRR